MSEAFVVRKLDFRFDEALGFQSNPGNPAFGNVSNALSIIGPCFEKYFIRAFRQAMPLVRDPHLRQQAEWFCAQEAQHSRHHFAHINALVRKYPGLKETQQAVMDSYMALLERESLDYHLAYTAILELAFGPTSKFVIEQRDAFLRHCDTTVASLVLWHLVEEFEHRNCALNMYNALVGSYWFRLKTIPSVVRHLLDVGDIMTAGFLQHVPREDNPFGHDNLTGLTRGISNRELLRYLYRLVLSQAPLHKPDNLRTPHWAEQWFLHERSGRDMTRYYP